MSYVPTFHFTNQSITAILNFHYSLDVAACKQRPQKVRKSKVLKLKLKLFICKDVLFSNWRKLILILILMWALNLNVSSITSHRVFYSIKLLNWLPSSTIFKLILHLLPRCLPNTVTKNFLAFIGKLCPLDAGTKDCKSFFKR